MKWSTALLSLATASFVSAGLPSQTFNNAPFKTVDSVTIFSPPADYTDPRVLYARTLQIKNGDDTGVILATWENYLPNNDTFPYFPIYESYDQGQTWCERSRLYDQVNGWGARYQPFIYEMQQDLAGFKKGDILLAGNFIPDDLTQTKIDVYVSSDKGHNWKFVSSVAQGGRAIPNNGETPVWEPFLMVYENQLVCFYSDQRDFVNNGQKLVHQTSADGLTWDPLVNDVATNNSDWRPGMTIVSELPNGQFIMTYEFFGAVEGPFSVYYKLSDSPLTFNEAEGNVLRATDGFVPEGSPYNVWTPVGGANGTIVASSGGAQDLFINTQLAAPGSLWTRVPVAEKQSYTRSLLVLSNPAGILISGGGSLPPAANNTVTDTVIDISKVGAPTGYGRAAKAFKA